MRVLAAIIAALWLLNNTNQLGVNADEKAVRRASSICFSKLCMVSCKSNSWVQLAALKGDCMCCQLKEHKCWHVRL